MYFERSLHQCVCYLGLTPKRVLYEMCMSADGAAAVEALRAELARAKEQARCSDAAVLKQLGAKLRRKYPHWRLN